MHDEQAGKADSRIDLNRAGTPLLEIVSQPDMRSPAEAKAYLTELKLLLNYLGVSDCNMQEGSLRVDANINLHVHTPEGKVPTPIVEVKNMNSFRAVERAMIYEAPRQYEAWQETGKRLGQAPKETRGWDDAAQMTLPQRSKEESSDYRYFPDPDLVPVTISDEWIERARGSLGELPAQLRTRLEQTYGISPYDSDVIVNQGRPLVDYYIELADGCGDGKLASNWIQQDVLRTLNETQAAIGHYPVSASALADLIRRCAAGQTGDQPRPRGPRRDGRQRQLRRRGHAIARHPPSGRRRPRDAGPRIAPGQSQGPRRPEGRQPQGRRLAHRASEEAEPEREPEPVPRGVPQIGGGGGERVGER